MTDLAAKFAGARSFIPTLEDALAAFHDSVARHIRPWQARTAMEEEEDVTVEAPAERDEPAMAVEPERRVTQSGKLEGKAYSIFDDGSIEVETGNGVQRFKSFAELSAAAARKNGHARGPASGL